MIVLAVSSLLIGVLLGLRFKVYILIPAIFSVLALVILIDLARGNDFWWLAISVGLVTVGLQVGYLIGAVVPILLAVGSAHKCSQGHMLPDERHELRVR